jgi:serine/threonine protein kinase
MSLCINPNCQDPQNPDNQLFCHNCGSELLLEGRYRVTRQLGSGGFGQTYEVSDRDSTPKVLKILTNNNPKYVELFQREAQVLSRLKHQGIPKAEPDAYFIFLPRNRREPLHCLVMEKIEGLDLREYLQRRGGPIDQKYAIEWLTQLATILKEVHSQNFFHRDIKPSNIMLKVDGQLVLIDFGTAREITESFVLKQASGQVTGVISTGYTPPEQFNGQAVPQSDFFALGRTFVFLVTAKDPNNFYDSYIDQLHWRDAAPQISPQLADLLDRLMVRFPNQRPQTAEVILQQLAQISRDSYVPQAGSPLTPPVNPLKAEPTQYVPFLASPISPPNQATQPLIPSTSPQTSSRLNQDFINRCKQELAEVIGPIASIICQRTLNQNPSLSPTEFVEALAQKIPNQKQALEFQRRLLP